MGCVSVGGDEGERVCFKLRRQVSTKRLTCTKKANASVAQVHRHQGRAYEIKISDVQKRRLKTSKNRRADLSMTAIGVFTVIKVQHNGSSISPNPARYLSYFRLNYCLRRRRRMFFNIRPLYTDYLGRACKRVNSHPSPSVLYVAQ